MIYVVSKTSSPLDPPVRGEEYAAYRGDQPNYTGPVASHHGDISFIKGRRRCGLNR